MMQAVLLSLALNSGLQSKIYTLCKKEFGSQVAEEKSKFYAPLIQKVAKKYNVPPKILASVIWHESNFKPRMISKAGARGLMQVMPFWFKKGQDWKNPETNLLVGTELLVQYRNRFNGDWHRALTAYCMGPLRVSRGMYRSRYSSSVMKQAVQ